MYAPNNESDKINFFKLVIKLIKTHCDNLNNLIVGGDFKTCLKVIDRLPVAAKTDRSTGSLKNLLQSCNLMDGWNTKYPSNPGLMYFDKKNKCHSKLDYFMIGKNSSFKLIKYTNYPTGMR